MPDDPILFLDAIPHDALGRVGGKGLNLARLRAAGFPVPDGFAITTDALATGELSPELREAIVAARRRLGPGAVAVRSSATAEDAAEASFAGQHATLLNVETDEALIDAVRECRASLHTARAGAYRTDRADEGRHAQTSLGVAPGDDTRPAMAVVVQRMVPAEAAGVVFTVDPVSGRDDCLVIEAAAGLGERVVSGAVTPDRYTVEREGLTVIGSQAQAAPVLSEAHLAQLARLALDIENVFGAPQDIEWALAAGELAILQARPITAAGEGVAAEVRRQLHDLADPGGTCWSRYNIAEAIPAPLPMTWSVLRHFMSGRGGYGRCFRDCGFRPSPRVDELGLLDRVAGRICVNLSREAELYFHGVPFRHDLAALKADPAAACYPKPAIRPTLGFVLLLPLHAWRMIRAERTLLKLRNAADQALREETIPQYLSHVGQGRSVDLSSLSVEQLVARFEARRQAVMTDCASALLKGSLLAEFTLGRLRDLWTKRRGDPFPAAPLVAALPAGDEGSIEDALRRLGSGGWTLDQFIERYGHRCPNEMELAEPRWREAPEQARQLAASAPQARPQPSGTLVDSLLGEVPALRPEIDFLRRYLPFRTLGRHVLMMGYELLRRTLVELDRRLGLDGGVFYLEREDLAELPQRERLVDLIAQRRADRKRWLRLDLPPVLFSDEPLVRPPADAADILRGTPVSPGVASGPAFVAREPVPPDQFPEGAVLVCPSTDPAWTPLLAKAAALVMERGGVLSHGAILAREYGLPAVVNITDATRRIPAGARLHVDATEGVVTVSDPR